MRHLANWILSRLVPERVRDALIGDLVEEYALRSQTSSSEARKWYVRQVCGSVPALLWAGIRRGEWLTTLGLALAAYFAVAVVELAVNRVIASSFHPFMFVLTLPMVVLIGYLAARLRRRAATVLAAMMLLTVTVMTLSTSENVPLWYRIVYFFSGPAAAFLGGALHARRPRAFL